jgi:hypothetical protein
LWLAVRCADDVGGHVFRLQRIWRDTARAVATLVAVVIAVAEIQPERSVTAENSANVAKDRDEVIDV